MRISVTGKKIEIGQVFISYIEEHLSHSVDKLFPHALEGHVTLTKNGHHVLIADIHVHAGRGIDLCGSAQASEPYAAFNKALEKLTNQLRRYKNRLKDHHSRSEKIEHLKASMYVLKPSNTDEVNQKAAPTIVAEMETEIPTLSVSEAVMRLDLSNMPVIIFKNAKHGKINTVYRREDNNIGWIDPENSDN
mgnify:CR=1 FL=1